MNILDAEDLIKGLPDQALMQEAQVPSGQIPQFLVVSEIQRRSDMRKRYEAQQQQPQGTVAEQIVREGIMGMAPQQPMMPQGMPQAMPQAMPQGMPPMGMAQGGIVRMKKGGILRQLSSLGSDPNSPYFGKTNQDQIDTMLATMSYPDVLAFLTRMFTGDAQREVLDYVKAKTEGEGAGMKLAGETSMIPEMKEVLAREPYESKEARMPMLAGGSDIYKAPMVVRAADALGLFDAFKGEPEPERMAEPMASALARQVESQYATPDLSQRLTADMLTGANPVPSRVAESYSKLPAGPVGRMVSPEYDQAVAERRAGIGDFFSDLSDQFAEGRARDREFINRGYGRGSKPGYESNEQLEGITELVQEVQRDASTPRPPLLAAGNAKVPYTDYESAMDVRNGGMDFSMLDEYMAGLGKQAGDKSVQGKSKIQAQPAPTDDLLDLSDIIKESRRMAGANALIQLGAGIAGGDLSRGIAASGVAASQGMSDARAAAIRERLAKYQAGREDLAREDRLSQFEREFGLSERKLEALIEQNADTTQREMLRTLVSLFEGESDLEKRASYAAQIQDMLKQLSGQPMVVGGMQTGQQDYSGFSIRR